MRVAEKANNIMAYIANWYTTLSGRERSLIFASLAVIIPLSVYSMIYKPVNQKFHDQQLILTKMEQDLKAIPHILDRYTRFNQKKDEIEAEFKEVDISEGEKTFLENILTGKVEPGFQITPATTTPFGGNYEQASFAIKFTTTSLQNVVDVLTAISTGKKRMLLTTVTISKPRTGDKLEVQLNASSIRALVK